MSSQMFYRGGLFIKTSFNEFLKEQLKDPEVKAEYDALDLEFTAIQAEIDATGHEKD